MNKKIILPFLILVTLAHADLWYRVALDSFKKVEVSTSGQIVLEYAFPNWDGAATLNQWDSMALAGQSTGRMP